MAIEERSKLLSYLLRHKPEKANLTLSKEGWVSVEDLCRNTDFTPAELDTIVANDEKGRYTIQFDGLNDLIRANQGHSTDKVQLTFKKTVPPVTLYHGTSFKLYDAIWKEGLKPMNRHHVHLSADLDTAKAVAGRRRNETAILRVDAKAMLADGIQFYLSDNGVWLVDAVPPKYLSLLK